MFRRAVCTLVTLLVICSGCSRTIEIIRAKGNDRKCEFLVGAAQVDVVTTDEWTLAVCRPGAQADDRSPAGVAVAPNEAFRLFRGVNWSEDWRLLRIDNGHAVFSVAGRHYSCYDLLALLTGIPTRSYHATIIVCPAPR